MLEIAENYESLARRAAERSQEATGGDRRGNNSFERTTGCLSPDGSHARERSDRADDAR
jgi:hypothetical protein